MNKQPNTPSNNGKYIITAPIVKKEFLKKNGEPTGFGEYYLQRSIQDYFIKFCESEVTKEELESHLTTLDPFIQVLNLEVSFGDGTWDICDDNFEQQSRIGEYVVIHQIIS